MNTSTATGLFDHKDEQLLRAWDVAKLLGISVPTVWRWSSEGKLPKPIKISPRVTVWKKTEIIPSVEVLVSQ